MELFCAGEGAGSKSCRRASTSIVFCVGKDGRGKRQDIILSGKGELGLEYLPQGGHRGTVLRRGAGRPHDIAVNVKRGGGVWLGELPQGECRDTALCGEGWEGRQDMVLSGTMGSSGSKRCRKASAVALFCRGAMGRGQGVGGRAGGWAAGYCPERGEGEFGLEELPQGGHREMVLRGEGRGGGAAAAGYCSEREKRGGGRARKAAAGRAPENCSARGGKGGEGGGKLF